MGLIIKPQKALWQMAPSTRYSFFDVTIIMTLVMPYLDLHLIHNWTHYRPQYQCTSILHLPSLPTSLPPHLLISEFHFHVTYHFLYPIPSLIYTIHALPPSQIISLQIAVVGASLLSAQSLVSCIRINGQISCSLRILFDSVVCLPFSLDFAWYGSPPLVRWYDK